MEEKEQTPPLQVPTEANNYKHIDIPENDDMKKQEDNEPEKNQQGETAVDKSNDSSFSDALQEEKIIDPGNEHHHQDEEDANKNKEASAESEPGEGKNDEPDTSGEAG